MVMILKNVKGLFLFLIKSIIFRGLHQNKLNTYIKPAFCVLHPTSCSCVSMSSLSVSLYSCLTVLVLTALVTIVQRPGWPLLTKVLLAMTNFNNFFLGKLHQNNLLLTLLHRLLGTKMGMMNEYIYEWVYI